MSKMCSTYLIYITSHPEFFHGLKFDALIFRALFFLSFSLRHDATRSPGRLERVERLRGDRGKPGGDHGPDGDLCPAGNDPELQHVLPQAQRDHRLPARLSGRAHQQIHATISEPDSDSRKRTARGKKFSAQKYVYYLRNYNGLCKEIGFIALSRNTNNGASIRLSGGKIPYQMIV